MTGGYFADAARRGATAALPEGSAAAVGLAANSRPVVSLVPTVGDVRTTARYDSYARSYDEWLTPFAQRATPLIRAWLGPGPGRCLELG